MSEEGHRCKFPLVREFLNAAFSAEAVGICWDMSP